MQVTRDSRSFKEREDLRLRRLTSDQTTGNRVISSF